RPPTELPPTRRPNFRLDVARPVGEPPLLGRPDPAPARLGPAVDRNVVARHERRHVRGEEERDARLVFGPAEAADGGPGGPEVRRVLVAGDVVDLGRLREVGTDAVDADAVAALLGGEAGREVGDRALERAVDRLAGIAAQA